MLCVGQEEDQGAGLGDEAGAGSSPQAPSEQSFKIDKGEHSGQGRAGAKALREGPCRGVEVRVVGEEMRVEAGR